MHIGKKIFVVILLLLVAGTMFTGAGMAFAAEAAENNMIYLVSDDPSSGNLDGIFNFKAKLNEYGFYAAGAGDDVLHNRALDPMTMDAVQLVCQYNPDLVYYTDGVSYDLYWRVMGENTDGKELKTPLDEQYKLLEPGVTDEAVTRVQNRLNQLGYDAAGYTYTPGVYDEELQKVIDAFVACNKFVYEPEDGITVELQQLLFSGDALPYEPASVPGSLGERLLRYFGKKGAFGLPNWALYVAGFVMLCIIVTLVMRLVSPGGKEEKGAQKVTFTVEYNGEICTHSENLNSRVEIGRAVGNFPLNKGDESISRKHCEIYYEKKNLVLLDHSTFGTKVNGKLCHNESQVLRSGDVIEVGKHKITLQIQK